MSGYIIGGPSSLTETSTTLPYGKGFGLGDAATGPDGTEYRYGQASAAITQYDTVFIDKDYSVAAITAALAVTPGMIGSNQNATMATGEYGWFAVAGGNATIRVAASASADAVLWTSSTAGVLTSTAASASQIPLLGIKSASAGTAGGVTNVAGFLAYPAAGTINI